MMAINGVTTCVFDGLQTGFTAIIVNIREDHLGPFASQGNG